MTKDGLEIRILSRGNLGTYNIDSAIHGITELQVGSFVFMDVDYRRIGDESRPIYTDFKPSLDGGDHRGQCQPSRSGHRGRRDYKALATDVASRPQAKGKRGLDL